MKNKGKVKYWKRILHSMCVEEKRYASRKKKKGWR
jgi:hypothetical protein